jgi:3-oxoacyl-[acyl-carrier-protein] synthase II
VTRGPRPDAERVVITGLGLVCPLGIGCEESWAAARAGRSAAGPITRFDASDLRVRIACEVPDFRPEEFMERKAARRMDRFAQLAVAAGRLALADAGLSVEGDGARIGAVVASGSGGNETFEAQHRILLERGADRVSPLAIPMLIVNMGAGQVAMELGLRGPCSCHVTACASSTHALGEAAALIRAGAADVMLAGGAEAGVTPFCVASLDATKALSRSDAEPATVSRPFDVGRDGFVMGEGAALLVLERLDRARERGATVIAEIAGYAATADAHHLTEPAPSGLPQAAAVTGALADAGLGPDAIGYVNAHGTSTPAGDPAEVRALRAALGEEVAARTPTSSTKSMHGHCMGATGAIEAALTALAIREGLLPPTINLDDLDPDCAGLDHVRVSRAATVGAALSTSFGFGGHNAAIVIAAAPA